MIIDMLFRTILFFSAKYNCHINVEICASINSVKYADFHLFSLQKELQRQSSLAQRNTIMYFTRLVDFVWLSNLCLSSSVTAFAAASLNRQDVLSEKLNRSLIIKLLDAVKVA